MKPNSYPKVQQFGNRFIQDILEGTYYLEEKIDGSQISFGVYADELHIRSKGAQLYTDNPDGMFRDGIKAIQNIADVLIPYHTYRGEYLQKQKHNTLAYSRIPKNHIVIFDIEDINGNPFPPESKRKMVENLGFETPQLFDVEIKTADDILNLMNTESMLGGTTIEGVVIKNYGKLVPDGKYMVGKYVSEKFKEKHVKEWRGNNPSAKDIISLIGEELKTEARYIKAVQHLRDNGQLTETPKDIGNLLKEIHKDIDEEEQEYIKEKLYRNNVQNIKRIACSGFAEWYKEYLLRGSF